MPFLTTSLENTSPLLVYSSNWRAETSEDASAAKSYPAGSTFTFTDSAGATMSLGFYGSSVTVFGARRGNHASYNASIDGIPSSTPIDSASPDEFNQLLYKANVSPGFHNLTITNDEDAYLEIDYVTIQTSIGNDNETIVNNTFQDSHPSFNYTPSSSWTNPSYMIASFAGGSGHATTDPLATANFTFQGIFVKVGHFSPLTFRSPSGDAVALYGPVGPNSSAFSAQIDNGRPSFFSANKQIYRPQQILFFAGNLGAGQHSLIVQPMAGPAMGELAIDYASVYTTRVIASSPVSDVDIQQKGGSAPPFPPVFIALAVGMPVLTLIVVLFAWFRRRRLGTAHPSAFRSNYRRVPHRHRHHHHHHHPHHHHHRIPNC